MDKDSKNSALEKLILLLKLEKIEENIFRGKSEDLGFGSIFGGQVFGQSLSAAAKTIGKEKQAHSVHGYFLRPGNPELPVIYKVKNLRDGRSFSTRQVKAIQKGKIIFSMTASFHIEENGFEHQSSMPDLPVPENLVSDLEYLRKIKDKLPEPIRKKLIRDKPVEIRQVNPVDPFKPEKKEPFKYAWLKASGILPKDPLIHKLILAYASDFGFLPTSLYPHGQTFWGPEMAVASLDHSIWFHRKFKMDQWLLYSMESPSASGSRGFNRGQIFNKDGVLVASTAQEGLIRYKGSKSKKD
ncbi:MAG: acyl-CoA thioesterase II [Desulforegulaceae bacterium]|nr:acyl-CoA thioesterase II [Desulforegulaceae bacterium]